MFGRAKKNIHADNDYCLLRLKLPPEPPAQGTTEMLFEAFYETLGPPERRTGLLSGALAEHMSLELRVRKDKLDLYIWLPSHLRKLVEYEISRLLPGVSVTKTDDDYSRRRKPGSQTCGAELALIRSELLPIDCPSRVAAQYFEAIKQSMSQLKQGEEMWLQVLARPLGRKWVVKQSKTIGRLSANQPEIDRSISEKLSRSLFACKIRILFTSDDKRGARSGLEILGAALGRFKNINHNGFRLKAFSYSPDQRLQYHARFFIDENMVLSSRELANLYNLDTTKLKPSVGNEVPAPSPGMSAFEKLLHEAEADVKHKADTPTIVTQVKTPLNRVKEFKQVPKGMVRLTARGATKERVGKLVARQIQDDESAETPEVVIRLR